MFDRKERRRRLDLQPRLRVTVLGCGAIARRFHLPALLSLDDVRVVGIADCDDDALAAARALVKEAIPHKDWKSALGQPGVDAVVVCLPSEMHATAAAECLGRAKHLYLEKPLALTLEDAEEIVARAEGSGVTAQIGFNFRFHPIVDAARSAIARGQLGRVLAVNGIVANQVRLEGWRGRGGGGALIDLAIHHIDLIRFILGDEFSEVSATRHPCQGGAQTVQLTGQMAQETLVNIMASNAARRLDQLALVGESNTLCLDRMTSSARLLHPPRSGRSWRHERVSSAIALAISAGKTALSASRRSPEPSFALALGAFVCAVRGGEELGPTLADGLEAVRVVAAAESALAGSGAAPLREPGERFIARPSVGRRRRSDPCPPLSRSETNG